MPVKGRGWLPARPNVSTLSITTHKPPGWRSVPPVGYSRPVAPVSATLT
jgi:hypothetical protein